MSITELSIKRPTLVTVIFAVLAIFGVTCYGLLKYDLLPKMNIPILTVATIYPGASATDVESSVTKKLEDALSSLENVDNMISNSQEGVSMITISLSSGADVDKALQDAQRKINSVLSLLPVNAKTPSLFKFSSDDIPVMRLSVTANIPSTELYQLTVDKIKPQLSKLNGVGQFYLLGGTEREIKININKNKLDSYKLPIAGIYAALANANMELPTGRIESDRTQYTVRLSGKIKSVRELQNATIAKTATGSIIHLSDVADVYDGTAEQTTVNRMNNLNAIGIIIQKQSDANTVDVCQKVKAELTILETLYADQGVKFKIASDLSTNTLDSANAVMKDLILAIILVAFVMFFFLHSVRNSLIVMVSIPASIVSVFAAMYIFDFSLNMMTLLALSLVIGILVDDSIVVLENIHRHLEMKKNRKQAAIDGRSEIGFTAMAITMVDIVVFVPLALVTGMIGNILREFSLVIVFSTLMSLFVSFTVTPLLASRFSRIEKMTRNTLMGRLALGFESVFNTIVQKYERILKWSLVHRKSVYGIVILLLIGSFSLVPLGFVGTEFMPRPDNGELLIKLETDQQNNLYQTNILTQKVEKLLYSKPDVLKVSTNVGFSTSSFLGSSEPNKSEINLTIVPKSERKTTLDQYSTMIQDEIMQIPGIKASVTQASTMGNAEAPIQVLLRGSDMNVLYVEADSVMKLMRGVQGTKNITLSVEQSKPEMRISLDREKMAQLGLSVFDVSNSLRLSFAGNSDMKYSDKSDEYNINLRFDQFNRKNPADIGALTFINNQGKPVELQSFAQIQQSLGPTKLERYDRMSSLTVRCYVLGRPTGTVGEEIKSVVSKNIHSKEVSIEYIGQMKNQAEAFSSLVLAVMIAMIFVYLVMVALYNSYLYPFVVLFSIPMAAIGAILALALTGNYLNVFSFIGLIMLIGLVAKNAILLVDFTNQLREKGVKTYDALLEAGKERLRPILMTTLSMIFGMLPIALATGASSETKNGLAWVIIGGLTSSLLLTLVLVPAVYTTMNNWKEKLSNRKSKKKRPELDVVSDNE